MASSRKLSPDGLRRVAAEQAALRRVAMLVARGVEPDLVFAVVAEEVSALFNTDLAMIARLELDGELTVIAGHGLAHFEPGARFQLDPRLAAIVSAGQTGRASRFDADDPTAGDLPDGIRAEGARSLVHAPILVEGRVWGLIGVGSWRGRLSPDTEQGLAGFTELAGTAIANAEAQAALTASRARIVATADQTRRRIERDLHDGVQQRLVSLALRLPEPVEIAAYYAVSEALTNTAKHARASSAEVEVTAGEGILHVRVRDDGRGGADFGHGSGLIGLRDRMEALGGRISLLSPPGEGTTLYAELPLTTAAGVTS